MKWKTDHFLQCITLILVQTDNVPLSTLCDHATTASIGEFIFEVNYVYILENKPPPQFGPRLVLFFFFGGGGGREGFVGAMCNAAVQNCMKFNSMKMWACW